MKDSSDKETNSERVVRHFRKRKRRLLPRWEAPGKVYHVRSSTLPCRSEDLTARRPGQMLSQTLHYDDGRRYQLHCYVVMPDHFHVMLRPVPRDDGVVPLSEIMQAIKSVSARRINSLSGRRGSLWLEDGYTRMMRCEAEYWHTWHYMRHNPVKAGYVRRPHEWPWWWSLV